MDTYKKRWEGGLLRAEIFLEDRSCQKQGACARLMNILTAISEELEDHVAMIQQMAAQNPYLDITLVGIFGTSAGGCGATHAILDFPEFYKVCFSISGDHDARLDKAWWNELYQGYPVGPDYAEQSNVTLADRLKGHLLIVHLPVRGSDRHSRAGSDVCGSGRRVSAA